MNENKPIYSKTSQKIFLRIGKKHLFLQWMCYHTNPPNSWIHIIWVVILCTTLNFKKMGRRCSSKSAKCFIWSARPSRLLGHSRHIHISTYVQHIRLTNIYGIRIFTFFQFKLLWHLSWSWVFVRWLYMVNVYKARSNSPLHIKMRACFDHFNNIPF